MSKPSAGCPEIIVYAQHSTAREAPAHMRYAAAMVPRVVPAAGKRPAFTEPGTSWLATGATPEEARAKLVEVWRKQFPPPSEKELARRASAGQRPAPAREPQATLVTATGGGDAPGNISNQDLRS
jgi:hypothetical protein